MPVTEREILAEHMGASAFEKVYSGGFSSPSPTPYLAVSLFHTLLPLLIGVVRRIVQQLTRYMTISAFILDISAGFLSLGVILNSIDA